MKLSKKETTLNEKDALQDVLDGEKLLMNYYAVALTEGSSKAFRKEILKSYGGETDTQFLVFEEMLARNYYEVQPAAKMMLDEQTEKFSKVLKEIQG